MSREMINSGIPWIGDIPKGWNRIFLKHYFHFEKGKNAAIYTQEYIGSNLGDFPVYSGQTENQGIMGRINTFDYDESECLFTTTVGAKVMTPKILQGKFSLSQNCLIMKKIKDASVHWFFYGLSALFDYEKSLIPSHMQPSLRIEDLKKYILYIPSITEQQKMASFLDRKCAEIDEMIALQEKIIGELKAYKQAVITEAVTKGLNPDVPMKDSGIEWIGEIPKHWEVCKVKNSLKINPIQSHKLEEDTEVSYMPMECLRNGIIEKKSARYGSLPSLTEFSNGDIVMAKVTPCFENGNIAIATDLTNGVGFGTSEIFVFRCHDNTLSNYAFYYLQSPYVKARGVSSMTGTGGLKRINPHFFCDSAILLPSCSEQQKIADYLDAKCTKIDNLISIKLSKIDSLKEYKKSIIYEYVTGKKEV